MLTADVNLTDYGIFGILGLGPPPDSGIDAAVRSKYGNSSALGHSLLYNFFTENPALPKVVTLRLTRLNDPQDIQSGGLFSLGEYDQNYPAIINILHVGLSGQHFWRAFMSMGCLSKSNRTSQKSRLITLLHSLTAAILSVRYLFSSGTQSIPAFLELSSILRNRFGSSRARPRLLLKWSSGTLLQ